MKKDSVSVGIIGFGTVGSGTAKTLLENSDVIRGRLGFPVILKKIADKDILRNRGIKIPSGVLTQSADEIIEDPDIDIVVELIGGIRPAKDFMLRAIGRKKHIVTANKALLATEGAEIFSAATANGVRVGFEASVAGGIPIIKVIREGLVANRFQKIYGIINGTSNFILTKMTDEGRDFGEVLAEAQRLGYAEADPTFDIDGTDSAHKLTILASLAYGIPLSYKKVYKEGITGITAEDIAFASELGYKIKLLGITKKSPDGKVELRVHPTMLPKDALIAKVDGVFNAVFVSGDSVGDTLYYGRGAGDMPTGSAVVADICDIAKTIMSGSVPSPVEFGNSPASIRPMDEVESMYYFRFTAFDKPGVLSKISGILGGNNISIASVIQKGRKEGGAVPLVVLTHKAVERDILKSVAEIDKLNVVSDKTVFIRVEGEEE